MANKPTTPTSGPSMGSYTFLWDGSDFQALHGDSNGYASVNVKGSALPAGAATEAKQDDQIVIETAIQGLLDAGGYSGSRLNTIANALTSGGYSASRLDDIKTALESGGDTESAIQAVVSKLIAAPATEAKQDTIIAKDDLIEWSGTATTGYDGTADITLTPSVAPAVGASRYVDSIEVQGTDDGGSGSSSVTVYLFRDSGATPGASKLVLVTSATINIAGGVFADRISPNARPGFLVNAAQRLYVKIVPDANTITASVSAFTCAGR